MRFANTNPKHVALLPALLLIAACGGGRGDSSAGTATRATPAPGTVTSPPATGTVRYFAYVTNQSDVSAFSINADTGALTPVGAHIAAGTYPNAITVHASGKFAYVANTGSNDISAYSIDATTGALTSTGAPLAAGADPFSVTVHPGGKFAYVANYTSRDVWAYAINPATGVLTSMGAVASGLSANTESVIVDPSGKFAYVTVVGIHPGSSDIPAYTIDSAAGTLTAVGAANLWTDKFPNAMAVHPGGKVAYVAYLDASSYKISTYSIDGASGALAEVGTPVLAGSPAGPASIAVDPGGKFVYAANLSSNDISGYLVDAATGALTSMGAPVAAGLAPRSITVDPSGKFAYVANYNSSDISAYAIDPATGALSAVGAPVATGLHPVFITTARTIE